MPNEMPHAPNCQRHRILVRPSTFDHMCSLLLGLRPRRRKIRDQDACNQVGVGYIRLSLPTIVIPAPAEGGAAGVLLTVAQAQRRKATPLQWRS